MRKITFYCDRCGKEITGTVYQLATIWFGADTPEVTECDYGADLCAECNRIVDDAVLAEMQIGKQLQQIEEAKAKKAEKKIAPKVNKAHHKSKLDLGRIAALYRNNWTIKNIADDLRVSEQTIRNHLQEALDFLDKKNVREDLAEVLENDIKEA